MVAADEFIHLPYTLDLTRAGLVYACKRITQINLDDENDPINEMRLLVSQTVVELAIKRYLHQNKIPHYYSQLMLFSDPDHMILTIGGRRCVICNTIISNKKTIRKTRISPSTLLVHPVHIVDDLLHNQLLTNDDIFIFSILFSLITTSRQDCLKAKQASEPIYQVALLPSHWPGSKKQGSLGNLECICQYPEDLTIQIGATGFDHNYLTTTMEIKSGRATINLNNFSEIHFLGTDNIPHGKINLVDNKLKSTITIQPWDWRNIWLYGLEILLAGFTTLGNLKQQNHRTRNINGISYSRSPSKDYLSIPVSNLYPLGELFNQAKQWDN